jgi:DNA repair exonuclease SbcCD ATPase subunit
MKKKLVLWGANESDEKVLIAVELLESDDAVKVYSFNQDIATEQFYKDLMDKWRNDEEMSFPDGAITYNRPLSLTESILPDELKVDRTDLINRAKTEWQFVVLSSKLYSMYKSELEDLSEKVKGLSDFENSVWEELKGFWSKVQTQSRDRNLFREHANQLRDETNKLFESLKEMRKKLDQEFKSKSTESREHFMETLKDIQEKVDKGLGLSPLFQELKDIQKKFKDAPFTREDRRKVWDKLDNAFKTIKEKRFGSRDGDGSGSALQRVEKRYQGLMSAIKKMENSIKRDKSDIEYQDRIIGQTDGQLEQQIRQAKIKMINERIQSKELKLKDMIETKSKLDAKIESLKKKHEKEKEQEKIKEMKEQVKERIAKDIQEKSKELESDEKVQKAAATIQEIKEPLKPEKPKEPVKPAEPIEPAQAKEETEKEENEESLLGAIGTALGESLEDIVDTVKAVAEVVGDKIEDKIEEVTNSDEEE